MIEVWYREELRLITTSQQSLTAYSNENAERAGNGSLRMTNTFNRSKDARLG
jgi:hypothetical protein